MASFTIASIFTCVLLTVCTRQTLADDLCGSTSGSDVAWRRHPVHCGSLYLCVLGRAVVYQKCPDGQVVATDGTTCVTEGSPLDDCTLLVADDKQTANAPKTCKLGETEPSSDSCSKYSECVTMGKTTVATVVMECPYPLLFDSVSAKCDHYKNVKCQPGQMVPKNPCDYEANQCRSSHCIPCHIRYPSCNGKQDGVHPWAGKEWSPFFVICEKERVAYQGQCKSDKEVQIFHPEQKTCVAYDEKMNF